MSAVGSAVAAGESTWSAASAGIDTARTAIASPCVLFIVFLLVRRTQPAGSPPCGEAGGPLDPPVERCWDRYEGRGAIGSDRKIPALDLSEALHPAAQPIRTRRSHGASAALVPGAQPLMQNS